MARRHLAQIRANPAPVPGTDLGTLDVGAFIPAATPGYHTPRHLPQLLDAFRRIDRGEIVHLILSVPPRHEKTSTAQHGMAWLMKRHPTWRFAYCTHGADTAAEKSVETRKIAERAGVDLGGKATEAKWETAAGGMFYAAGVLGEWTGRGYNVIVTDDTIKNRRQAESAVERKRITEGWKSDVFTRKEPGGTSQIVIAARWHPDDLPGVLERDLDRDASGTRWEVVKLPAINAEGEALAPWLWSIERLRQEQADLGPYRWNALYQQNPGLRGGRVFQGVQTYSELPPTLRKAIGLDLAFTTKTSGDWSVSVVIGRDTTVRPPRHYILDVIRKQVQAPDFGLSLKAHHSRHPGAGMRWYVAGGEKGTADFLRRAGITRIKALPATADKFVRAQPVAAAWNGLPEEGIPGTVFVPEQAPWLEDFLDEVLDFTGAGDGHDDQVDALAAAFDELGPIAAGDNLVTTTDVGSEADGVERLF